MSDDGSNTPDLPAILHNADEAVVIENAIRAAVNTVMDVMYSACNRRLLEYQRMVDDRDAEIRRLECSLRQSESELRTLRLEAGRTQNEDGCDATESNTGECVSVDTKQTTNEHCGVGAATPTPVSTKCRETAEAFPHQHTQTQTPIWEGAAPAPTSAPPPSAAAAAAAGDQPFGCIALPVKEEPSELGTVIKCEVCEGTLQNQGQPEKLAQHDTLAECEVKTANPLMKSMTAEDKDEQAACLKRKGGERNGCHLPESEEENVAVKKPCVTQASAPKITALKDNLGHIRSPNAQRNSTNGSLPFNLNAQEALACQQQTYASTSGPQTTCDPILLEVLVSLETIKQQNTTVLQILQSGNSSAAQPCEPPDVGTLPLPLQSVQDLRSLEQRISTEPELKKEMISYLSLSGGMTTKESVWRIMAKLFTNTLAKNINWRGRNNKQKIENLTLKRVILNAVRQNSFCKDAVDEEIERYIKRWLQLAGDRDGGRKRRQEKGKESDSMRNYCVDEMFANVIE